jgi:hypothetical protein
VVIAFVGESGMNVLHEDFRTADGRTPRYPAALGKVTVVSLPAHGTFAERRAAVASGSLGHLIPGQLYGIRGTRLLVASAPGSEPQTDVTGSGTTVIQVGGSSDPTLHGTGVVDAAIGRRYGTAPNALGLLLLGSAGDAWSFVAGHHGIDLASTSDYGVAAPCVARNAVRSFTGAGHLVFSSSGNTTDQGETLSSPNGLPEVYQVGGVTADGKPYGIPPHPSDPEVFYGFGQVTKPYQTGELYDFPAAAYNNFTGTMRFGGTSGATPRTAGWAAKLLAHARSQRTTPARGPLRDGRLTRIELTNLLHHVAVPSSPGQPGDFWIEGYGALGAAAARKAERVLDGSLAEPIRAGDDANEAQVEQARTAVFDKCPLLPVEQ